AAAGRAQSGSALPVGPFGVSPPGLTISPPGLGMPPIFPIISCCFFIMSSLLNGVGLVAEPPPQPGNSGRGTAAHKARTGRRRRIIDAAWCGDWLVPAAGCRPPVGLKYPTRPRGCKEKSGPAFAGRRTEEPGQLMTTPPDEAEADLAWKGYASAAMMPSFLISLALSAVLLTGGWDIEGIRGLGGAGGSVLFFGAPPAILGVQGTRLLYPRAPSLLP